MDGQLFSPTLFSFPSALFPFAFFSFGSFHWFVFSFVSAYLVLIDPMNHSTNLFSYCETVHQRGSLPHILLRSTVFCCFLTIFSTTYKSFIRHNDFTRCRPYSRFVCDRSSRFLRPQSQLGVGRCFVLPHECASCSHVVFVRFRLCWFFVSLVQPIWEFCCSCLQSVHASPCAVHSAPAE
jgi:hypothetical protein